MSFRKYGLLISNMDITLRTKMSRGPRLNERNLEGGARHKPVFPTSMAENIFSITITKAALISPNERKKVADMIRPFITEQRYQGATLTHTISH